MTRRTISLTVGVVLAAILVAACSGSSSSAAPSSAGLASSAPETVAPSASAPASEAPASEAPSAEASFAIPSFELPSDDKGLEALLPDQMCGKKATKASMSGDRFASISDKSFLDTLNKLGKSASDVSFAVAVGAPSSGCDNTAIIFRVKGADSGRLRDFFIAAAKAQNDTTWTTGNVAGHDVYIGTQPDTKNKTYAWFRGDALLLVEAKDDATAAPMIQGMP